MGPPFWVATMLAQVNSIGISYSDTGFAQTKTVY